MEGEHFVKLPPQILHQIRSLDVLYCSLEKRGLDILAGSIPHLHSLTSLNVSYNEGGVSEIGAGIETTWETGDATYE